MTFDLELPDNAGTGAFQNMPQVLLLALISVVYLYWSWTDQLVGFGGDNAFYVLMAQYYSPYSDPGSTIAEYFARHSQFPPLYPLVLAFLGGAGDFLVAHQITTGSLIAAFAALPMWASRLGLPMPVCTALMLGFAILPGTYSQTLHLHSENLYLLLTLAFFVVAARARQSPTQYVALALLAAATALTRTAGIALIGAFLIFMIVRRPTGWLTYSAIAILPPLLWNVHAYWLGVHYVGSISVAVEDDPITQIIARITTQFHALQYGWLQNLTSSASLWPYCLALGIFCTFASVVRAKDLEVDGFYVILYLMMMLLWPFPAEAVRFMFVIVPVLLLQGTWLLAKLIAITKSGYGFRYLSGLVPAIALIVALPGALLAYQRLQTPLPLEVSRFKRDPAFLQGTSADASLTAYTNKAVTDAMLDIATIIPRDNCILAIKPSVVALLSNRLAKAPPSSSASDGDFFDGLRAAGCKHALMLNMISPTYATPLYPLGRMNGRINVVSTYTIPGVNARAEALVAAIGEVEISDN